MENLTYPRLHDILLDAQNDRLKPEEALNRLAGRNFENEDPPFNHGMGNFWEACGVTQDEVASIAEEIDFGSTRTVSQRVEALEKGIKKYPHELRKIVILALLSPPTSSL